MSVIESLNKIFPRIVKIKFPILVIMVSSSLDAFLSYLEPNIISASLSFSKLYIPKISIGLKDPSALKIQK